MKIFSILLYFVLLINSCRNKPDQWNGPKLTQPRDELTVEQLQGDSLLAYMDMSYYTLPDWAGEATQGLSGSVSFHDTEMTMTYPQGREPYEGENIFPGITIDFITKDGELIPIQKNLIITRNHSKSFWDVMVGVGKVWQEAQDGEWSRASFPITLTDRYIGQARNCVATFVYKADTMSNVCVQCSQETADLNDHQVGNMLVRLQAKYEPKHYADSTQVIERHRQFEKRRLPVFPLSTIDSKHEVADYFEKSLYTNAPTSLGALLVDGKLYLHPPKTRHGLYPYPAEMRHGLYSVTKSMAGALSILYFAERYGEAIFDELITDYVPALAEHPGWQGVTFSHALNMVTGTIGSESAAHLLNTLILARTAEESIHNIADLGDTPEAPGEKFNYASTNLFVLSYALQNYVEEKEGVAVYYWDLVRDNVLIPIGADYFTVMHTVETNGSKGIPRLAYGALPTIDEAAKIALLFLNEGNYEGKQLLNREKTREALGRTAWTGYSTDNDYRGKNYRHAFWATDIKANGCDADITYMLGFGANYLWFFPSGVIAFRFMDEYDLDFKDLVKSVERIRSSCK
ncbi:serine hydrolase domain-containing protein [Gaoshiqia sediminis]|uniref:Serine hydrolase n=1 Tax=Gaoshiqia sediminis TaxID=2986998 RepID=A0AA41YBD4_9BACT|nr:serine hydrolase [Gaoshiqia sediminis]MCW0483053.1 serine hydrolase [Gaoshiqia sediminis]